MNRKPKKCKEVNKVQSIATSMPFNVEKELGLEDLFTGTLTHLSFDCPTKLREAFKQEVKSNGTSVCKELQKFQLSYIATSRIKKHALGDTLSKALTVDFTIENLNFEQYVQSRPRRLLKQDDGLGSTELSLCEIGDCKNVAVAAGIYLPLNETRQLCKVHLYAYSSMPKAWKIIQQKNFIKPTPKEALN